MEAWRSAYAPTTSPSLLVEPPGRPLVELPLDELGMGIVEGSMSVIDLLQESKKEEKNIES